MMVNEGRELGKIRKRVERLLREREVNGNEGMWNREREGNQKGGKYGK